MRPARLLLACGLLALMPALPAGAHVAATGLAVVAVDDRAVAYRLTVVPAELPEAAARLLMQAMAGSRPDAERLAAAMRRAVAVRIDGAPCHAGRVAIQDGGYGGLKAVLEYRLHCPAAPGHLELEEDWSELFGPHYATIATVEAPRGAGEQVLGEGSRRLSVDFGAPGPAGLFGFVRLGVRHILTGYDHLLFLLALLIGAANFWRVLGIASAFTLAHSITLSLAATKLVEAPAALVEPLIAASIIWVAVENMLGEGRLWRRFAVAFVFGLVHGLGFAGALHPLALAGWSLVRALAGFNLGVELGQAMAILVAFPALFAIARLARSALVYRCASLAVAAAGAWWLVQRVHFG